MRSDLISVNETYRHNECGAIDDAIIADNYGIFHRYVFITEGQRCVCDAEDGIGLLGAASRNETSDAKVYRVLYRKWNNNVTETACSVIS